MQTQNEKRAVAVPGPRFGNLPLSQADQVRLLFYAELLATLWLGALGAEADGMPVTSELCAEVRAIVARAENRSVTEEAA